MAKRRLGVVLLVPPPWASEIDGLRRALGDGALGRIPTHLTLVPPVNVNEDRLGEAVGVLREAAGRTSPFTVHLGPPATFLPVNPVVHLAVDGKGADEVRRLREAVFSGPLERSLSWPFVPHVTLADEADPDRIASALRALRDYEIDIAFNCVHLLEEGAGRTWSPIADARFSAPAVIGRGGLELTLHPSASLDVEAERWQDAAWVDALADHGVAEEDQPFAFTARRGEAIAGTATGTIRAAEAHLARLIVGADDRGTGVGTQLLAAVESLAAEAGCGRLTVRTSAEGSARQFFEGRGWRVYATLSRWRAGTDFVAMERVLQ